MADEVSVLNNATVALVTSTDSTLPSLPQATMERSSSLQSGQEHRNYLRLSATDAIVAMSTNGYLPVTISPFDGRALVDPSKVSTSESSFVGEDSVGKMFKARAQFLAEINSKILIDALSGDANAYTPEVIEAATTLFVRLADLEMMLPEKNDLEGWQKLREKLTIILGEDYLGNNPSQKIAQIFTSEVNERDMVLLLGLNKVMLDNALENGPSKKLMSVKQDLINDTSSLTTADYIKENKHKSVLSQILVGLAVVFSVSYNQDLDAIVIPTLRFPNNPNFISSNENSNSKNYSSFQSALRHLIGPDEIINEPWEYGKAREQELLSRWVEGITYEETKKKQKKEKENFFQTKNNAQELETKREKVASSTSISNPGLQFNINPTGLDVIAESPETAADRVGGAFEDEAKIAEINKRKRTVKK
jgi:hypothetical protein